MASETIYALAASNVTVSDGGQLSGISQGDGSHLDGRTITLNTNDWVAVLLNEGDNDNNFADNDGSQRLQGDQVFDGVTYADNVRVEAEYQIIVTDPNGVQYTMLALNFNEPGGGNSYSTVEGLVFVDTGNGFPPINTVLTVFSTSEGPSVPYADLAAPPCFTPGSVICTPRGLVDVDDLVVGDCVPTMDHGLRQIEWIGRTRLPKSVLEQNPSFRPVLIKSGALGNGLPLSDMRVSPQHRLLITGWQAELHFGESEVLVPAIKLCNGKTIYQEAPTDAVTFIHIMFAAHEIVWVDGVATESYLPSAHDRTAMGQELQQLFPDKISATAPMLTARPCVSDRRVVALAS